jgi:type VI secretion system ImpM family protein
VIGWLRRRGEATATVGCYGKLPLDREFLRLNATAPEVEAVDRWVQAGMAAAHSRLDGTPEGAGRGVYGGWRGGDFLIPPQERGQRYCLGHIHPSQDSAGRRFPCTLFLLASGRQAEPAYLAPLRYHAYLEAAAQVVQLGEEIGDRAAWLERVRGLASLAEPRAVDFPVEEGVAERLARLLPDGASHAATLQLLVETVVDRPRGGWVVRLPVVGNATAVAGWLHLVECLRPRDGAAHAAVWGDAALWLAAGSPAPGLFLNLLGLAEDDRLVDGGDPATLAAVAGRVLPGVTAALDPGGVALSRLSSWRWR